MPVSPWPPPRVYFAALGGFFTGASTSWATVLVQLSGKTEPIAGATWVTVFLAGMVSAFAMGKVTWDAWNAAQAASSNIPLFGTRQ